MALWNLKMHLINNEFYDKLSYSISMQLSSNMSSGAKFFNIIMPCVELRFQNISSSNVMIRFLISILISQFHNKSPIINPNEVNQRHIFFFVHKQFVC